MTYCSVRRNQQGRYVGWCGHRHRYVDQAQACTRRLQASWHGTGETWTTVTTAQRDRMSSARLSRPSG